MKRIVVGILAHVDAGKTTLSEALLYKAGTTRRLGRVDKGDAYLDTHAIERERGITVFSKQAIIEYRDTYITLIDTPGHIDFSSEAERALSVEDYAILVISADDGVTAHTKTLWNMLSSRGIPTFIFVNKTDIAKRRRKEVLEEIKTTLTPSAVDFTSVGSTAFFESAAGCSEELMAEFFETDALSRGSIVSAISKRKIFPCLFGSALKLDGVSELLSLIDEYTLEGAYPADMLGAVVYKIARDEAGKRLTYIKLTGGMLKNKDTLALKDKYGDCRYEKIEQIRVYSGDRYKTVGECVAGMVLALVGPVSTRVGEGIGFEPDAECTVEPVLDYRLVLPKGQSPYEIYMRLLSLTEEDPTLAMAYEPETHEIRVRLMGEIQIEVLKELILTRFGIEVGFDEGEILYKETVAGAVYGAGHFEPLRHYAEVHLRLEPMPEGTGIVTATECPTDTLSLNWQRLILSHVEERKHRGVLTASPLTDVKITLTAGRAHLKHTEGGDFRQATYRAVRQALMKAECILLEPTFDFKITLPLTMLGRATTDITNMHGVAEPPEIDGDFATLIGTCPVATMRSYASEVRAYTRGEGKIQLSVGKYAPCHNATEVIAARGYNPELDERNSAGSVFCKGGSGYFVPWNEADALMHLTPEGRSASRESSVPKISGTAPKTVKKEASDEELMKIFEATYGKVKPRYVGERVENNAPEAPKKERPKKQKERREDLFIIDGYNFIFAIAHLSDIARVDIDRARDTLIRMACNFSAFKKCKSIVVFDAYKRVGAEGTELKYGSVTVVYTKEKQTADAYIERLAHELSDTRVVRVVTSDKDEQLMVLGVGALRVSAREFYLELSDAYALIRESIEEYALGKR